MNNIITTQGVCKKYGKKTIFSNINISVNEGDVYGIIGNNGTGKSTLLKIICGLTSATDGKIEIGNTKDGKKPLIGALIEHPALFFDMTGFQNLKAKAICLGIKHPDAQINELLESVGLSDVGKKHVAAYSLGMKQRLGIALALIGDPEILILDEPINGLDPQGILEIRNLLTKLNQTKHTTILISSHILDELAKITNRFCLINRGRVIKECPTKEFVSECGEKSLDEYYLDLITKDNAESKK